MRAPRRFVPPRRSEPAHSWRASMTSSHSIDRSCSEPDCDRPFYARNRCSIHYVRAKKRGEFGNPPCPTPGCAGFVTIRGLCDYHYHAARIAGLINHENKRQCTNAPCNKIGVTRGYCSACYSKLTWRGTIGTHRCIISGCQSLTFRRGGRCKVHEYRRAEYGASDSELIEMQSKPFCVICGRPARHIDHCHRTSKIRGLLCRQCNSALGLFQDRPDLLRRAAEYLESNGSVS